MITHFFNPPRYMRLLELVVGESTDPIKAEKIRAFADERLGKGVVDVHDTPGFVANRIGGFWVRCAISEATQAELTVEEADAVMGRPMGAPKTGVFGLIDLVGLDVSTYVARSLGENLPADDPFHSVNTESALMKRLIENGYTGRKGKGGFYRLDTSGGRRVKQAVDLATGEYHTASRPRLGCVEAAKRGGLRALVEFPDAGGAYAWRVLSSTLSYAASLVPDVAGDITAVDEAMRLGYNWKKGPFELIDELGVSWFARTLEDEGRPVPPLLATAVRVSEADGGRGEDGGAFYRVAEGGLQYLMTDGNYADVRRRPGVLMLADVKRRSDRLAGNSSASLWDLGDDVVCLEFHSKMNAYDDGTLKMFGSAIETIMTEGYKGLVLYSDGDNYSVGANIGLALFAANIGLWPAVEEMLDGGQQAYRFMKYAPFPVVGAPAGLALGGGCESLLHSDAIVAHAESYIGLPEAGLGLLPGWGGTKEMLLRHTRNEKRMKGPVPPIAGAFETISMAKVSRSAEEARDLLFLRPGDTIVMNRDRLLAEAKARVLELAESYEPPEEPVLHLPGPSGRAALDIFVGEFRNAGKASEHDAAVSHEIATVLTGGDTDITEEVSETDLLDLERECFIRLVRQPKSLARIEHMLETGKPLRN
jgi:3-hydroxyacyl-CoA dehydrogenase